MVNLSDLARSFINAWLGNQRMPTVLCPCHPAPRNPLTPSDDSTDPSRNAIVRLPGTDMAETSRRAHPVIARMTRDVLARAEAQGLDLARYRIGDYLLRGRTTARYGTGPSPWV